MSVLASMNRYLRRARISRLIMLTQAKVLKALQQKCITLWLMRKERPFMEQHYSFYLGADVFYSYIVENGWWKLRIKQKTQEGYYRYAPELREKLMHGKFPKDVQEQFVQML